MEFFSTVIGTAYGSPFRHFSRFLSQSLVGSILAVGGIVGFAIATGVNNVWLNACWTGLIFALFAVRWHRLIIIDERSGRWMIYGYDMFYIAVAVGLLLAYGLISIIPVVNLIAVLAGLLLLPRLLLILPATAVDENMTMGGSWNKTKGHTLALAFGFLICNLPTAALSLAELPLSLLAEESITHAVIVGLVGTVFELFALAVNVGFLSSSYKILVGVPLTRNTRPASYSRYTFAHKAARNDAQPTVRKSGLAQRAVTVTGELWSYGNYGYSEIPRRQPERQADVDLHLRQTRSPAHSLGNGSRHTRHRLVLLFSSSPLTSCFNGGVF